MTVPMQLAAVERSGTVGRREPPPGWPVACRGRRMRVITSHGSGWRGVCRQRALVASCVMLPRGIPRGNIRGGRDPLAGGTRTGCSITPRSHMFPTASRSRDSPPGCLCGAERKVDDDSSNSTKITLPAPTIPLCIRKGYKMTVPMQ
jgi:hypothetical protein